MDKKIFLLKLKPELVKEIITDSIQDSLNEFFIIGESRGLIVFSNDANENFYAQCIYWHVDEDDEDMTGFSLDIKEWGSKNFISNNLQNLLKEKDIESDYIFSKISNQKLLEFVKQYILSANIVDLKNRNRQILDISFLVADTEEFAKCIVVLSEKHKFNVPTVYDIDKMIDYTDGDIGRLIPRIVCVNDNGEIKKILHKTNEEMT
ncbi:MAG: hypothetical protein PHX09_02270 [Clostridia bacterium]|nr:hypothetical protein [Clostridia bacterium]MDD4686251.1 hypothetical protein [Clostridia bacterium]